MQEQEIKKLLEEILYELETSSTWSGHCYGAEYLEDYYKQVVGYSEQLHLDCSALRESFTDASDEFDKAFSSPINNIEQLKKYDSIFLEELAKSCQRLAEHIGVGDDYLVFYKE